MKTLTQYTKDGIERRIIHRSGNIAIAQGKHDFEVIIVQSHNGRIIVGKECPPAEYAPHSEQWGSKGWTFQTLAAAMTKLEMLEQMPVPATHSDRQARFESPEGEDSGNAVTMP